MTIKSLQSTSLTNNIFYRSMLAGNDAFFPESESDDFLEEVVLSSSASSVTFSSLASYATAGYKDLQIRYVGRSSRGNSTGDPIRITLNGSNPTYSHHLFSFGSSVGSGSIANSYSILTGLTALDAPANSFGAGLIDVVDAFSAYKNTTIRSFAGMDSQLSLNSAFWNSTAATASIALTSFSGTNFLAGSRFSLYGSKG
jgi:hypothetical protein